jgi:hypothetical protein
MEVSALSKSDFLLNVEHIYIYIYIYIYTHIYKYYLQYLLLPVTLLSMVKESETNKERKFNAVSRTFNQVNLI